jgi:signal transduction histidine kinase
MDFFSKYRHQIARRIALPLGVHAIVLFATAMYLRVALPHDPDLFFLILGIVYVVGLLFAGAFILRDSVEPVQNIWDVVQYIAPNSDQHVTPDIDHARIGRELVSKLANHVYQLASVMDDVERTKATQAQDIHANFVANSLPLPFFVIDGENQIVFANDAASKYIGVPAAELAGQDADTALAMSFADEETLESWLATVRSKNATADKQWERVRIGLPGQSDSKQFDLAAHYNRSNPLGYETLLVMFDHTEIYSQDDQAMSFVALTVHELRTPLTLLRGYIEVFNEELGPTLDPELKEFMVKMDASAQQLTAFVNNILNVAKIEDNQLTLQLHKDNWHDIVESVVRDLSLRASVRGVVLKTTIADGLPPVGVDRYSIYEVLANLIDNAIKYCGTAKEVHISSRLDSDGRVETSVKDFGLGIDANILPHVFDKFYRNHRNRAQIGGTGLGLYLSRAIVQAHGGQISVSSKVNEGSTFTFTVLPFDKLAEAGKTGSDSGVVRGAHGWIKNHSMYRE